MKEQNKKFSNNFQSFTNNLNNNQANKVINNNSELEKFNNSNKNDLTGKINSKNQKDINNGSKNEERPKSPVSRYNYLNSPNLKRLEKNENDIPESNNPNISEEKKIYFYFKKNLPNSSISNRGNYSPQVSSRRREVIIDYLDSDISKSELNRNINNKNNFFSVSIDTELHQDLRKENLLKNKRYKNNFNNQENKNISSIKLTDKIGINKEKYDYIDKMMKTSNSLVSKENDIKINTEGKSSYEFYSKNKKSEVNKNKNVNKMDNDKMKKPLKDYLSKKNKKVKFGDKKVINSPKYEKEKNKYINKNEKLIYLNTFSNQNNFSINEKKEKEIIKKGLNMNSIIMAKKFENKIMNNYQTKKTTNIKEKNKYDKSKKNNNKITNNKNETNNINKTNKNNENNMKNSKDIKQVEININNIEEKVFIIKEKEGIKRNEKKDNIKIDDNKDNNKFENKNSQDIVQNIIIKRDLSNRNNNAIYISKNDSKKRSVSASKIIQDDTNNNTIYISSYFGNNKNNNMNSNINIHFRKNSENLISSKTYLKNENEINNNSSKNNNPINPTFNTDIKTNNREKYFFSNIKNNKIEKINLNLDNKNYIANKQINIQENRDKQIVKNNIASITEKKIRDKKIINEQNMTNKLFKGPNNIININIKVNPKINVLNNSQKINDFKSNSNTKPKGKDFSKIIDIITNKNNNSPYKMNKNNKINQPIINNKENNNIIINMKNLNRNNSGFILLNKDDLNKNKMVNSSSSSNIINSYNKNQNNLSQFSKNNKKPSKIIIQNVVIENNAINNNIFFSNNDVPTNNYLINAFKPPFGIQNSEENNLNKEIYIQNLKKTNEITKNIIYPIKENKYFFNNINDLNYTERKPNVNLEISNKEINKRQKINKDDSFSRNQIKSPHLLRHSNSDFIQNSVEKLISSDNTSSSKLIVINSATKERRMNELKGRSRSLLSNGPKAKCLICNKLVESHLLQIHINAHPSEVFKWLYLGTFSNACDNEELRRINIKYVLNCAFECINKTLPKDIKELHLKISDNKNFDIIPFFQQANDFINQARLDGGKILIHCKLGISRSAAITIAYLIKYYGLNFNSALKFIKKQRNRINPNKGFMEQLKKYESMVQNKIKRK